MVQGYGIIVVGGTVQYGRDHGRDQLGWYLVRWHLARLLSKPSRTLLTRHCRVDYSGDRGARHRPLGQQERLLLMWCDKRESGCLSGRQGDWRPARIVGGLWRVLEDGRVYSWV